MVSISGTKITMTRGDTLSTIVSMTLGGETYTPQEGDSIRFAMKGPEMTADKGEFIDTEPLVEKDIPTDTLLLKLDPDDTKGLDFGTYVYDIQLTYANGDVDTFIYDKLKLTPEVD